MSEANADVPDEGVGYHTGPVTLRRSSGAGLPTDQRLLDNKGRADWLHTDRGGSCASRASSSRAAPWPSWGRP